MREKSSKTLELKYRLRIVGKNLRGTLSQAIGKSPTRVNPHLSQRRKKKTAPPRRRDTPTNEMSQKASTSAYLVKKRQHLTKSWPRKHQVLGGMSQGRNWGDGSGKGGKTKVTIYQGVGGAGMALGRGNGKGAQQSEAGE